MMYRIQEMVSDDSFRMYDDENSAKNLISHRSIANKIEFIKETTEYGISTEVQKLADNFQKFREFYGDHYKDPEYMKKSAKEISNYISLIDDICDAIHMKLQ